MGSKAALRWRILRRSLLSNSGEEEEEAITEVSRVPRGSYGLLTPNLLDEVGTDVLLEYSLPEKQEKLVMRQAKENGFNLNDHSICRELSIDNTGVVCMWPAEEVLAYYCVMHSELFRGKRVIELGAGYGLAGLAIAVFTEATEVVITDGNPKVVNYIEENIRLNSAFIGETKVSSCNLYWGRDDVQTDFDVVIASDCTYFKDFHKDLIAIIKKLLGTSQGSEALLFCPRRGRSLDDFVKTAIDVGLKVFFEEKYDDQIWERHCACLEKQTWLNYDEEHNYPLRISISA